MKFKYEKPFVQTASQSALSPLLSLFRNPLAQLVAVSIFFLLFFVDFGKTNRFWQLFSDFLHSPIFFIATLFVFFALGGTRKAQLISCFALAFASSAVEIIQPFFGRSESLVDGENGLLGIALAGILISFLRAGRLRLAFRLSPVFLVIGLLPLKPAFHEREIHRARVNQLPLLANFESAFEQEFFSPLSESSPREKLYITKNSLEGRKALEVHTVPFRFSGVEMRLDSMDWTPWKFFAFDVFSPEPFTLWIRLDDWKDCGSFDARFNRAVTIEQGWNHIAIPLSEIERGPKYRKLELGELRRLLLFREASQSAWTFRLDSLRLE